jgi:hypothetical protein
VERGAFIIDVRTIPPADDGRLVGALRAAFAC